MKAQETGALKQIYIYSLSTGIFITSLHCRQYFYCSHYRTTPLKKR